MVDALERNEIKLKEVYEQLKAATDPVQLESIQTRMDNLLDIRLSLQKQTQRENC